MGNVERMAKLDSEGYQKIFGVKKKTFEIMLEILKKEHKHRNLKGGRPGKLSVLDKLVIMLCYYLEYRVMENIAFDYGVSKSTICDSIRWVEETLIKSGKFNLPSKEELTRGDGIEVVLIDATECEIERPKKQKEYYSGKKKKHTIKLQIAANAATMDILSIAISKGRTHDFRLLKDSKLHFSSKAEVLADKGYLGISALHPNSTIPVNASKSHKFSSEEKAFNFALSKRRIYIEHINRYIKRFRILSSHYRNKRRHFALRASLICGIYNFQH